MRGEKHIMAPRKVCFVSKRSLILPRPIFRDKVPFVPNLFLDKTNKEKKLVLMGPRNPAYGQYLIIYKIILRQTINLNWSRISEPSTASIFTS